MVVAALVATIYFQRRTIVQQKENVKVLENNVNSLSLGITRYKVRDSLNAVKIIQLNMRAGEAEQLVDSLEFIAKELGVKYKNLQSYVDLHLNSQVEIKVPVYDTLYLGTEAQHINYHTKWNSLQGVVYNNTFEGVIGCSHEIKILDEKIYKGWWIFKRLKRVDVKAMVMNPRDTITSLKSIKIEKRKKKRSLE